MLLVTLYVTLAIGTRNIWWRIWTRLYVNIVSEIFTGVVARLQLEQFWSISHLWTPEGLTETLGITTSQSSSSLHPSCLVHSSTDVNPQGSPSYIFSIITSASWSVSQENHHKTVDTRDGLGKQTWKQDFGAGLPTTQLQNETPWPQAVACNC